MKKNWTLDMANKWKNYKPPIRPSKYDLEVFEDYIKEKLKQNKDVKILILGSTPEFRDLASKHKLIPYVVDYNEMNNRALATLKKHKGKEILIKQDWRKLKLKEKFDLVFAEASLNMLKEKEVPLILKNVKRLLKKDGVFLAKTWTRIPKSQLSLKKILETYRSKYKHLSFKNAANQEFHSYFYDRNKGSLKKQYFLYKELYEKGIITKKEFNSIEGLGYETNPLVIWLPFKEHLTKLVRKYMKVIKIIYPRQIGTNRLPIYVLKR